MPSHIAHGIGAIHEVEVAATMAAMPVTPTRAPRKATPLLRSALAVVGDLFLAMGLVLCIPLVILAVAIPIALLVQLLLWLARLM